MLHARSFGRYTPSRMRAQVPSNASVRVWVLCKHRFRASFLNEAQAKWRILRGRWVKDFTNLFQTISPINQNLKRTVETPVPTMSVVISLRDDSHIVSKTATLLQKNTHKPVGVDDPTTRSQTQTNSRRGGYHPPENTNASTREANSLPYYDIAIVFMGMVMCARATSLPRLSVIN